MKRLCAGTVAGAVVWGVVAALGALLVQAPVALGAAPEGSSPPPGPVVTSIEPDSLPAGPRPRVAYLVGTTIHTPSGGTVAVPRQGRPGGQLVLLGRSPRGWVLHDEGLGAESVFRLDHGRIHQLDRAFIDYAITGWMLSSDGTRVLGTRFERDGTGSATVIGIGGRRIDRRGFRNGPSAVAFTGATAVLANSRRTYLWHVGGAIDEVDDRPSALADVDRDLLLVVVPGGLVGPTSLSAPGVPAWRARLSAPALNADGSLVLGAKGFYLSQAAVVRSVADGSVQFAVRGGTTYEDPVVWESDDTVLLGVRGDRGRALVRCTLAAVCERATPWSPQTARFSIPPPPAG